MENYLPGQLKKFGLEYNDLRSINDRLIYCSITGLKKRFLVTNTKIYFFNFRLWKSWSLFKKTRLRFNYSSPWWNDEYNRKFSKISILVFILFVYIVLFINQ